MTTPNILTTITAVFDDKISSNTPLRPRRIVEAQFHTFLISAVVVVNCVLRPLYPWENNHLMGDFQRGEGGVTAGQAFGQQSNLSFPPEIKSLIIQCAP
jgi:hypothetical protein